MVTVVTQSWGEWHCMLLRDGGGMHVVTERGREDGGEGESFHYVIFGVNTEDYYHSSTRSEEHTD